MSGNRITPCVIIPGIGQSHVVKYENGQASGRAWPPAFDGDRLMGELKGSLMKMMLFRRDGGFSDKIAGIVSDMAEPLTVKADGNMKYDLKAVKYNSCFGKSEEAEKKTMCGMMPVKELAEATGEENLYYFTYNSFEDPYVSAAALDEYIEKIKEETGSSKVNFMAVSLGGTVAEAYLSRYGSKKDIERAVFVVAALDGTYFVSDFLSESFADKKGSDLMLSIIPEKLSADLSSILPMLPEEVPGNIFEKVTDIINEKIFLNSPAIWACVPSGEYEKLADRLLEGKKELREKTDKFQKDRKEFFESLKNPPEGGAEIFCICGYGKKLIPIVASENMSSDGIINVSSAGLGAVSAPAGEKLPSHEGNAYLSPDGTLDASANPLRNTSWYFSDQGHEAVAHNPRAIELIKKLLSDSNFKDIYSDENLPQFMAAEDNRK